MNYEIEIEQYRKLCNKYYPYSYSTSNYINNNNYRIILLKILQIANLIEIFLNYDVSENEQLEDFCNMILVTLFDILLAIPTSNSLFISACMRQLSEKLLELVYSEFYISKNITLERLLKLRYRDIWEDGIQKSPQYKLFANDDKQKLDNINDIFKKESNILHFKYNKSNTANYLEEIITSGCKFDIKVIDQQIGKIHMFCIDLLPRILNIDFNKFSMNQKYEYLNLVKFLKPKPFKKK